jgi:hypothetical protein
MMVVAITFHFEDNTSLKKLNGTLFVSDFSIQFVEIHSRKTETVRECGPEIR